MRTGQTTPQTFGGWFGLYVLCSAGTIEPQWECVFLCTGVQLEDVLMSVLLQA